jgi:hypothetical protein
MQTLEGNQIANLRKHLGLTRKQMSVVSGHSEHKIRDLERGRGKFNKQLYDGLMTALGKTTVGLPQMTNHPLPGNIRHSLMTDKIQPDTLEDEDIDQGTKIYSKKDKIHEIMFYLEKSFADSFTIYPTKEVQHLSEFHLDEKDRMVIDIYYDDSFLPQTFVVAPKKVIMLRSIIDCSDNGVADVNIFVLN